MPYTLQSSGDKQSVLSQVNGQITGTYNTSPEGKDREVVKQRMEAIRDYLFNDLGGDFPEDSPVGLVLVGDAGEKFVSITRLEFSISQPPTKPVENAAPVKEQAVPEGNAMNPPAPDKGPVPENTTTGLSSNPTEAQKVIPGNGPDATTPSPNFEAQSTLNPTVSTPAPGTTTGW